MHFMKEQQFLKTNKKVFKNKHENSSKSIKIARKQH